MTAIVAIESSATDDRLASLRSAIVSDVVRAIRKELHLGSAALLTVPEVARLYRRSRDEVRLAAVEGRVKCRKTKSRAGSCAYLIDAKDAARVWGAQ